MAKSASTNSQVILQPNSYFVPKNSNGHLGSEDHIIKKTPLMGAKITATKIANDIFVYSRKGLKGSVNSNFYEFLSLGIVPYVIGSGTLIALFNVANKVFNKQDKAIANFKGIQMAAGVVLYGVGKWLGGKMINKGVQAHTGIDMDMAYKKTIRELPENSRRKGATRVEFHKVFESTDFPRWDLINKQGEQNNNRYEYYDKIAKKMNYKEKLNSPDQTVQPKIKETVTKATAAKSISSYLWAALGVVIAAQSPFGNLLDFGGNLTLTKGEKFKAFPGKLANAFKKSVVNLYKGVVTDSATGTSKISKSAGIFGKTLIFAAIGSTVLGILNANRGFKEGNKHKNSKIDFKKDVTEA